jgi:hypothetical protein
VTPLINEVSKPYTFYRLVTTLTFEFLDSSKCPDKTFLRMSNCVKKAVKWCLVLSEGNDRQFHDALAADYCLSCSSLSTRQCFVQKLPIWTNFLFDFSPNMFRPPEQKISYLIKRSYKPETIGPKAKNEKKRFLITAPPSDRSQEFY